MRNDAVKAACDKILSQTPFSGVPPTAPRPERGKFGMVYRLRLFSDRGILLTG